MKKRYFRVTYTWYPGRHGWDFPYDHKETSATVVRAESKADAMAQVKRSNPNVKPENASLSTYQ